MTSDPQKNHEKIITIIKINSINLVKLLIFIKIKLIFDFSAMSKSPLYKMKLIQQRLVLG